MSPQTESANEISLEEGIARLGALLDRHAELSGYKPRLRPAPQYGTAFKLKHLGAEWDCSADFDATGSFRPETRDEPAESPEIDVRHLTLNHVEVNFDAFSFDEQEAILNACIESLR